MQLIAETIDRYIAAHTEPESDLLRALAEETRRETRLPQMQVGHVEGAFLRMLVRLSRAERILEIGTFTGYSALVMAEALPEDGELITCDIDSHAVSIAKKYWDQSPHGYKIESMLGPALDTIPMMDGLFDFAFIDADKENYIYYWEAILPKMRPGGLIAADNVLWSGKVLKPSEKTDHALVAFNDRVIRDSRVESVMLTVRDGVTLAWKK